MFLLAEQHLVHFLLLFECVIMFTAQPKVDKGRAALVWCTKKTDKGLCACIHAMYPSHGNLLLNCCRV